MNRYTGLMILASLLAACSATSPEVRKGAPDPAVVSEKPPKEVAICITDAWQNGDEQKPTSTMRETKTGYAVVWTNAASGHTGLVADVDESGTGSATKFYPNKVPGVDYYRNAVAKCQ